jgi:hypothetical protein
MFWVTLAGVIAVVLYTSVAAWQACLTRGQLDVMQADQRAWVKLKSLELRTGLISDAAGLRFALRFELENIGKSIARSATLYTFVVQKWNKPGHEDGPTSPIDKLVAASESKEQYPKFLTISDDAIDLCAEVFSLNRYNRTRSNSSFSPANTIFPNDIIDGSIPVENNKEEFVGVDTGGAKFYNVVIVICVRYIEPSSNKVRYTPYLYGMYGVDPENAESEPALALDRQAFKIPELKLVKLAQYGE